MSPKSRASRLSGLTDSSLVERFPWSGTVAPDPPPPVTGPTGDASARRSHTIVADVEPSTPEHLSHIERDAFVKGYAQGEKSGSEATARQGEAMLRRLAATIDEVASLRTELMRRTERELVNLALVLAERIVRREVSLDRELLVTMARVAIDRLGERASATIRLNPADHAALTAGRSLPIAGPVEVVADPHVSRGGCLVRSDFGLMDLGIEAQINELSRALLGADESSESETSPMGAGASDV